MRKLSSTSIGSGTVDTVLAPLKALRPPTRQQLAAAHRRGQDPNRLIERFMADYTEACVAYARLADKLAAGDKGLRRRFAEASTEYAGAQRHRWFVEPQLHVAKLLAPATRQRDLLRLDRRLSRSLTVGHTITFIPRSTGHSPDRRVAVGAVAAPRERRDGSSSRTSGTDPGDDPDADDGLALGFVDRAPFLWRIRALRCRLLEIREGVHR